MCPECGEAILDCTCAAPDAIPEGDGVVHVFLDAKGRGGKKVTVIRGVLLPPSDLKALAKQLKARCGTGGTSKDGVIEIQGDQRELLAHELRARGHVVKQR